MVHVYKWGKPTRAFSNLADSMESARAGDTEIDALIKAITNNNEDSAVFYGEKREGVEFVQLPKRTKYEDSSEIFNYKPTKLYILAGANNDDFNRNVIRYLKENPTTLVVWIVTDTRFSTPPEYLTNLKILTHVENSENFSDFTYRHACYTIGKWGINRYRIAIVANQVTDSLDNSRWHRICEIVSNFNHLKAHLFGHWPDAEGVAKPEQLELMGPLKPYQLFYRLRKFDFCLHLDNIGDRPLDTTMTVKLYESIMMGLIPFTDSRIKWLPEKFKDVSNIESYIKKTPVANIIEDRAQLLRSMLDIPFEKRTC